jgi:hypothetical protein
MPERNEITEPTELVYLPRPSWAPALFALGAMMMVNGIYGEGFMVRGWVYLIIGAVVALAALRSLIAGAVRDFYGRPLKQRPHTAVLPAASLKPPAKQG